ncbi:MAG: cysteine peptidase family C39 domain-containing protein, partial [Gammaproteobacteria bacterium]|nr:cysteine peptidase family C39 domain-containing protein [Gammaproteobacteria bacterium]
MEATQTQAPPGAAAATPDDFVHSGIACLAMLLRFHHLAADPRQIAREHAPEQRDMDLLTLVRAARQLGLKARSVKVKAKRLEHTPLPAIAQLKGGGYAILAKVSGDKALLQHPGQAPQEMRVGDLLEKWTGFLMLATTAETLAGARRKF